MMIFSLIWTKKRVFQSDLKNNAIFLEMLIFRDIGKKATFLKISKLFSSNVDIFKDMVKNGIFKVISKKRYFW